MAPIISRGKFKTIHITYFLTLLYLEIVLFQASAIAPVMQVMLETASPNKENLLVDGQHQCLYQGVKLRSVIVFQVPSSSQALRLQKQLNLYTHLNRDIIGE